MALSADTKSDLNEWLGNLCIANGVDMLDRSAVMNCLYDNWDTAISRILLDAALTTQRTAKQDAVDTKQKAELEAQGYTVTAP